MIEKRHSDIVDFSDDRLLLSIFPKTLLPGIYFFLTSVSIFEINILGRIEEHDPSLCCKTSTNCKLLQTIMTCPIQSSCYSHTIFFTIMYLFVSVNYCELINVA